MKSETKCRSTLLFGATVAVAACLLARPAAAQLVVGAPDVDTALVTETTAIDGAIGGETTAIDGAIGTVNTSINTMDGNLTRELGFPTTGSEATALATAAAAVLGAAPTVVKLEAEVPGASDSSTSGKTITTTDDLALAKDIDPLGSGAAQSLNSRMRTGLTGIEGNAIDSLAQRELDDKTYGALLDSVKIQPSLGAAVAILEQLEITEIRAINNEGKDIDNEAIAASFPARLILEGRADTLADIKAAGVEFGLAP